MSRAKTQARGRIEALRRARHAITKPSHEKTPAAPA